MIYERAAWDDVFIQIALQQARRSHDSQTQHGCVIVDARNRILSTGFNGFPAGACDSELPTTRPEKYLYVLHAELNACLDAPRNPGERWKAYVTGEPCHECLKVMIQKGIKTIIHIDGHGTFATDPVKQAAGLLLCKQCGVEVRKYPAKGGA